MSEPLSTSDLFLMYATMSGFVFNKPYVEFVQFVKSFLKEYHLTITQLIKELEKDD